MVVKTKTFSKKKNVNWCTEDALMGLKCQGMLKIKIVNVYDVAATDEL